MEGGCVPSFVLKHHMYISSSKSFTYNMLRKIHLSYRKPSF